jgi:RNA polymerase sigma factor (sigma-70 family)
MKGMYLDRYKHSSVADSKYNQRMFTELKVASEEDRKDIMEDIFLANLKFTTFVLSKTVNVETTCEMYRILPDDLRSSAYVGLWKAVTSFDIDKGIRFATYAYQCISNEVLMLLRTLQRTGDDTSLNSIININDTDEEAELSAVISNLIVEVDEFEEVALRSLRESIISGLNGKIRDKHHLEIFNLFLSGTSQPDLARMYSLSQPQISRILKKCRTIAKEIYNKQNDGVLAI